MRCLQTCLVLALACIALATRITYDAPRAPSTWRFLADEQPDLDGSQVLHFSMKQSNLDKLEKALWAVSTPSSPKYGKHWTFDQVGALTAPSSSARALVENWLISNGVSLTAMTWTPYNSWLRVTVPRRLVEDILSVRLGTFEHTLTGRRVIRATSAYSLPKDVAAHINFVAGVTRFPRYRSHRNGSPAIELKVDATNNAPLVISNHQGEGQLQLLVAPRCEDGSFTTSASSPCSDNGAAITEIVVGASSGGSWRSTITPVPYTLSVPTPQCQICSSWALYSDYCGVGPLQANTVLCLLSFSGLQNYAPYNVSVSVNYNDDNSSDVYNLPLPITTFPWISVGLLRKLYNVPTGTTGGSSGNSQAVVEFLGQFYNSNDLDSFLSSQGLATAAGSVSNVGSPNNQSNPGGEANLDIQYIMGLAPNISTTFYLDLNLTNNQEDFMEWIMYMNSHNNMPLVQSVSYDDQEYSLTNAMINSLNAEFQKAGLRGISLLFAAGDDGVAGYDARTNSSFCSTFNPTYPGSSPYVTSIGGTQLSQDPTSICSQSQGFPGGLNFYCDNEFGVGETVCSVATGARITTGGGFSNVNVNRPAYQNSVVDAYLKTPQMAAIPKSLYNASGRAYPDISANAHNYVIYLGGQIVSVDGTSASTPVIAAMMALINDARLRVGMSSLGFLNPWLYDTAARFPSAFVDITQGDNACTANAMVCCQYGLPAAVGWDAVTGLGTPNFLTLRNVALNPDQPLPDSQYFEFPALIDHGEKVFIMVIFIILGAINLIAVGLMLWNWTAAHKSQRDAYSPIA